MIHLSGIGAVWSAATSKRLDEAERLGQEFSDELRLIVDDLGWEEHVEAEPIELTTPPEVVRRVMERIAAMAEAEEAEQQRERAAVQREEEEIRLVREACEQVLADLTNAA